MDIKVLESENEIYQKQKLLGEGAFGKAYLVRRKADGVLLVIKQMSIQHMSKQQKQQTIKQALILKNLNHPNIVKFIQVYVTKQNKLKIVMQYAECGDISKAIATHKKNKTYFQQNQIVDWFTQICLAIKHVHDRKILHRDIKGQNIFITKNNILKLGDFGIARILNKTMDKARTVVGTPYYLSPQIIQNKPYSFKSDIWSIGVVLYELCALQHPFTATSLQFLALKIVKGSYAQIPSQYSKQLKVILSSMLSLDPNKRPSVKEILQNPLIQNRIRNFLSQTKHAHEFSHTVLHNQKVELVSNRLVDIQQQKIYQKQRLKLKEQEQQIRKKMLQRQQSEQKLKQKKILQQIQQRKKQQEYRQKQIQKRKRAALALQQRQKEQYQQRMKIAKMIQKRQFEERQMQRKRLQHQQMLNKLDQKKQQDRKEQQNIKKLKKQLEEQKKQEQLKQFARKQFFQNQQIMRKAKQRANQDRYQESQPNGFNEPILKLQQKKKSQNNFHYRQKQIEQDYSSIKQNKKQQSTGSSSVSSYNSENRVQSKQKRPVQKQTKQGQFQSKNNNQTRQNVQKKHSSIREQMKKDKQIFLKNKKNQNFQQNYQIQEINKNQQYPPRLSEELKQPIQKVSKWERPKSREKLSPSNQNQVKKYEDSLIDISGNLIISPIQKEQFNQYLEQLQGILQNVHKNIDACQKNQKNKNQSPKKDNEKQSVTDKKEEKHQRQYISLQNMPIEEQIVFRDDDEDTLKFSLTAQFNLKQNQKQNPLPNVEESTDLDYFADYSKLQTLRMNLEDKFGTDNFVEIYRFLQNQVIQKGLQGFNIIQAVDQLGKKYNKKLLMENMSLLLTLIVMEQKMSAV